MKQFHQKHIEDLIKAREAEKQSVVDQHNSQWAKDEAVLKSLVEQHQAKQTEMQQYGGKNQLKITHLEGCIAELEKLLPKPKKK